MTDLETTDDPARMLPPSTDPRFGRPPVVLLRGALGAVALGALVVACGGSPSETPLASTSAAGTATQTPVASSIGPTGEPISGWSEVAAFGGEGGWEYVKAMVRSGDTFLAIGSRMEPLEGGHTTGYGNGPERMWTSPDGTVWDEVALGDEFEGVIFTGAVPSPGGGFVTFGWRGYATPYTGTPINEAWESADGRTWRAADADLPSLIIGKVVHGAQGYLLLAPQTAEQDPSLWLSPDALHWEEVHHFSQEVHWVQVEDVGAGDEGFVAVGVHINVDNTYERFAFASADGREWFESISPFGPENQQYRPPLVIAPLGADWVAAAGQLHDGPAIWFSANGLDWAAASVIHEAPDNYWPALVSSGGRAFLSTSGFFPDSYSATSVWSSTDGRQWPRLDIGQAFVGGAAEGTGVTLMGGASYPNADESDATFWLGAE